MPDDFWGVYERELKRREDEEREEIKREFYPPAPLVTGEESQHTEASPGPPAEPPTTPPTTPLTSTQMLQMDYLIGRQLTNEPRPTSVLDLLITIQRDLWRVGAMVMAKLEEGEGRWGKR